MRNNLKTVSCLLLVVFCIASFSISAFATKNEETTPIPSTEITKETNAASKEPTADIENPYNDVADNNGNILALTPDGNMTLVDDFLQVETPETQDAEQVEKQFITVQSKNGNTFYIVIDRNGETENVYFLNLVDESDLMLLMEGEELEALAPTCSCAEKCSIGTINTNCEICRTNMNECIGKEPVIELKPEQPTTPVEEPDEQTSPSILPLFVALVVGVIIFSIYWFKFRKPKTSGATDLDDYDFGEDEEVYDEKTELDDSDVMAEAEVEEEDA